ncbi:kinase-like domain-containing protein [Mycena sp. CBHHK59/15]|nr:kinase-like domain-containing protein [Mycena sp. CBHHK59/15]
MAPLSSSAPSTSAIRNASQTIPFMPQKFIGAVEDEWELFSDRSTDYTVGLPIGFGASSIVYAAEYRPQSADGKRIPCALKVLDLDSLPPHSLALLQRETTLMSLSKHPNVLRVRGSWMDGHKLHIALRLMNRGSAADIMRYGWPGGMEEDVVRCILRQALQGLNYLHVNGFIHRDVKAANLLIDNDGTVLLGDLGVAADLTEDTSRQPSSSSHNKTKIITAESALRANRSSSSGSSSGNGSKHIAFEAQPVGSRPKMGKRKSFVGTPCWMAPEVIQARHYDSSADIWSFGITALELTRGRPPRSRESPQRVLLQTIQDDPPTLDREGGTYKYSRAFKEIVESCLVKDPSKRPTAEGLLQSPFFKASKKKSYLVGAILKDLPPLAHRQERRVAHGPQLHGTVDSWDFATTLHSPTSTFRRTTLEQLAMEDIEGQTEGAVFEMDGEQPSMKRRSKAISFAEKELVAEVEPENEQALSSSPSMSSPSDQEFVDIPGSGSSHSSPAISPTLEKADPSDFETATAPPLAKPLVVPPVPVSAPLPVPTSSNLSSSPSQSYGLAAPLSSSVTSSRSSSSRTSSGLWKKIKGATGLRQSSSFTNVTEEKRRDAAKGSSKNKPKKAGL